MATRKIRYLGQPAFELIPIKHPDTVKVEGLQKKAYGELTFEEKKFLDDYGRNPKQVTFERKYRYDGKSEVLRDFPSDEAGQLLPKMVLTKYKFMPPDYIGTVSEADAVILDGNDFGTGSPMYQAADQVFLTPPKPEDADWQKEKGEMQAMIAGLKNEVQGVKMRLGKKDKGVAKKQPSEPPEPTVAAENAA